MERSAGHRTAPLILRFSESQISWRAAFSPTDLRCGISTFRRCLIFSAGNWTTAKSGTAESLTPPSAVPCGTGRFVPSLTQDCVLLSDVPPRLGRLPVDAKAIVGLRPSFLAHLR